MSAQQSPIDNMQPPRLSIQRPQMSGPFGLSRGMTKEQIIEKVGQDNVLKVEKDRAGGVTMFLKSVPKPHTSFIEYAVTVSATKGLLKIAAFTDVIDTAEDGTQLRDAFSSIREQLEMPYGVPSNVYDYVKHDSLWQEPREFMMGMLKHDRTLACYWFASEKTPLKDSITAISLNAHAKDTGSGMVFLGYEFEGWEQYSDELKSQEGSVL